MKLPRRQFLQRGLLLGASFSFVDLGGLFAETRPLGASASPAPSTPGLPDLVAVRDGDRATMVDRAIAALGGMAAFVKPGQSVVIKPNIGWDVPPERSANTHPDVVRRLAQMCFTAGAARVSVFDNTCDQWQRTYANSGIEAALKDTGVVIVNGKDRSLYRKVEIPNGVKLKSAEVHSLILDSDVFINAPVLKHHGGALMTACMKNLMGVIWDRQFYHKNDLHQCIVDFLTFKQPTLNVVDAYAPMVRNGPRGKSTEDLIETRTLLAGRNVVTCDAAAAKILGHQPADIRHVKLAADAGFGSLDLEKLNIQRIKLG
jgi:uncharacterized protein (DUF362 family)